MGGPPGLSDFAPEQVEQITGVAAARVERLARELAEITSVGGHHRRPAAGTAPTACSTRSPSTRSMRCSAASSDPGGVFFTPQINLRGRGEGACRDATVASASLDQVAAEILDGSSVPQVAAARRRQPGLHAHRRAGVCARRSRRFRTSSASVRSSTRRACAVGPDPAGSLVPRDVVRGAAGIGIDDGRGQRRAAGDDAAAPDAGNP